MTVTYRCSGCRAVIRHYKRAQDYFLPPAQIVEKIGFKCPRCGRFLDQYAWSFSPPVKAEVTA